MASVGMDMDTEGMPFGVAHSHTPCQYTTNSPLLLKRLMATASQAEVYSTNTWGLPAFWFPCSPM